MYVVALHTRIFDQKVHFEIDIFKTNSTIHLLLLLHFVALQMGFHLY